MEKRPSPPERSEPIRLPAGLSIIICQLGVYIKKERLAFFMIMDVLGVGYWVLGFRGFWMGYTKMDKKDEGMRQCI